MTVHRFFAHSTIIIDVLDYLNFQIETFATTSDRPAKG